MVDQERMQGYINMGMSIDDALKLCQDEDAQARKDAAKEAKAAAATPTEPTEPTETEPPEGYVKKEDVEKIVAETLANQQKEEALKKATENAGGEVKERTIDTIMEEAVTRMRTGK